MLTYIKSIYHFACLFTSQGTNIFRNIFLWCFYNLEALIPLCIYMRLYFTLYPIKNSYYKSDAVMHIHEIVFYSVSNQKQLLEK